MAQGNRKLLVVADDHPRVRQALEHMLAELHDVITVYTADHPDELRPLAERRLTEIEGLAIFDISLPQEGTSEQGGPEGACTPPLSASEDETSPLIVISMQEGPVTAHWFASVDTREEGADAPSLQSALDQREIVMDLIRSLHMAGSTPARAESGRELPDLASLMQLGLTQRQAEVLLSLAQGLTNKEIARQLGVSEWTVRNHVSAILERLDVGNRGKAALYARRLAGT